MFGPLWVGANFECCISSKNYFVNTILADKYNSAIKIIIFCSLKWYVMF